MRVAAVFSTWLAVGFFAVFAMGGSASAEILKVEPDAFPDLTVLNDKFPGVILSTQTLAPNHDVLTRIGIPGQPTPPVGTNIATTGEFVFGRGTAPTASDLIVWGQFRAGPSVVSAALRADFVVPADFVSIDAIGGANAGILLEAYDSSGTLLESRNPILCAPCPAGQTSEARTVSIDRTSETSPDISFILAYSPGNQRGGVHLDNLRVNFITIIPVVIDIKPGSEKNNVNICAKGAFPVAILSSETFDAPTEVDPATVDLSGAGVKTVGPDDRPVTQKKDVNKDKIKDLVLMIETEHLDLEGGDPLAELTGRTFDNTRIMGMGAIKVEERMCVRTLE